MVTGTNSISCNNGGNQRIKAIVRRCFRDVVVNKHDDDIGLLKRRWRFL